MNNFMNRQASLATHVENMRTDRLALLRIPARATSFESVRPAERPALRSRALRSEGEAPQNCERAVMRKGSNRRCAARETANRMDRFTVSHFSEEIDPENLIHEEISSLSQVGKQASVGRSQWHGSCDAKVQPATFPASQESNLERAGILIRDRNATLQVHDGLAAAGFDGVAFRDLTQLLRALRREECRLLFIDVDMPSEDWPATIDRLHDASSQRPVIVGIGATPHAASVALDGGADEFLSMPLSKPELCSRVKAAFRRLGDSHASATRLECGHCVLDLVTQQLVSKRGKVDLTAREAALAHALFRASGRLVSRRTLAGIWGLEEDLAGRTIEQHVYQLRRKLRLCVGHTLVLRGVYARGYQLDCVEGTSG